MYRSRLSSHEAVSSVEYSRLPRGSGNSRSRFAALGSWVSNASVDSCLDVDGIGECDGSDCARRDSWVYF